MTGTTLIFIAATTLIGVCAGTARAADNTCTQRGHAMLAALPAITLALADRHA